jgi:hypothetical protein
MAMQAAAVPHEMPVTMSVLARRMQACLTGGSVGYLKKDTRSSAVVSASALGRAQVLSRQYEERARRLR